MGLLLSPDHTAALTDPLTWKDNPFIARDRRRDVKKRQPFLSFCWMCGILLFIGAWGCSILFSGPATFHTIPLFFGGDVGTAICIFVAGIQIWFVAGAAQKHTTRLFPQEANQNTLGSLLMLPVSPFQLLMQSMAYPWLVAMRMAVALLPVYVFCAAIDGPTFLELIMLYLVFAMTAFSVPFWQRPALSENVAIVAPPDPARMGRTPNLGPGQQARSAGTTPLPGGILALTFIFPCLIYLVTVIQTRNHGLAVNTVYDSLNLYVPHGVVALMWTSLVSWPLMLARLLISPLDWFGFTLIPLPFVLILFLLKRYLQIVKASEYLSVGAYRDLPLQATYLPRRRMEVVLAIAQAVVAAGFLWKWAVWNGGLASFGPGVPGGAPGLAGFACLLLLFTAFWGIARGGKLGIWQNKPLIPGERHILRRNTLLNGIRYLAEPFVLAILFYLVCCLLSRTNPFPPLANSPARNLAALFWEVWTIGLSGAALSYGIARLLGDLSALPRILVPGLVLLSSLYQNSPGVQQWLASFPQVMRSLSFIPELVRLEIFSPFLGILYLCAPKWTGIGAIHPHHPAWWAWPAAAFSVGIGLWLAGHALSIYRPRPQSQDVVTLDFDPTILGAEVFNDPVALKKSAVGKMDTPFVTAVIAHLQRIWDNAVMTRELRSRLRGKWDNTTLKTALAVSLCVSLLFFQPTLRLIAQPFSYFAALFIGMGTIGSQYNSLATTAAGILGLWYLAFLMSAFGFAFSTSGVFYIETQKSTLGFLLATPMSTNSILLGKALGVLGPGLGVLSAIAAMILVLSTLFLPLLGPVVFLGWCIVILIGLTFYLKINVITFAISALFPRLSMASSVWIWILGFWFSMWPLSGFYAMITAILFSMRLSWASLWIAYVLVAWLLIVLAWVIALSGMNAMRRRDLSFGMNKRNN